MSGAELRNIVQAYLEVFPGDTEKLRALLNQIDEGERLNDRKNFRGHATGSGLVLSPDRTKLLLVHHKFLNAWLQPGGHWEGDEDANPLETARREIAEETGVQLGLLLSIDAGKPLVPVVIDTHPIPNRPEKQEPPHSHHDFRYAFVAGSERLKSQAREIHAAKWFAIDAPETASVRQTIERLRRFDLLDSADGLARSRSEAVRT